MKLRLNGLFCSKGSISLTLIVLHFFYLPKIIRCLIILGDDAVLTNTIALGIPAGLYDPFSFAGTDPGPFTVFAMLGSVDLNAPAFICG